MELITRIFSGLAMTAAVVTPLASVAALPSEGKSGLEQPLNTRPSQTNWTNQ